MSKQLAQ